MFLCGSQRHFVSLGFLCSNAIAALSKPVALSSPKAVTQTTIERTHVQTILFVQYFKVVREIKIKMDRAKLVLGCIHLRWQRTDGSLIGLSSVREFNLISLISIRGFVHIVCRSTIIALIDKGDEQSIAHFEMIDETKIWENETFQVNKLFSNGAEEFDIATSANSFCLDT